MINLLPDNIKSSVSYARRNTVLRHWAIAVGMAIVGIVAVIFLGLFYMDRSIATYTARAETTREQLRVQKIDETQKRVNEISSNLKLVVQVLSREILFSKVLKQIGGAIPSGAVLTDLTIGTVQGGIDLKFEAQNYQTATQIQLNLQDPKNQIFEKADLENITCTDTPVVGQRYNCTIAIRALFGKNTQYYSLLPPLQPAEVKP